MRFLLSLSISLSLLLAGAACVIGEQPIPAPGGDGDGDGDGGDDDGGEGDGGRPGCTGGDPFDAQRLATDLVYLASDELAGRGPGTPGDELARQFIADRFECLGLIPAGPSGSFALPFTTSRGVDTANVVGYLSGSDLAAEAIVVGAHHDHLGVVDGEIHNGANDNASGVVALLAIAQAMVQQPAPPRRTVVFATFGFEENVGPCEGSEHYAAHAPPELPIDNVVYMVNADMLGTYRQGGLTAYGSVPGSPAREILDERLGEYPSLSVALGELAGEDDSDFQAFCDRQIPYVYFETWDPGCYHEACDDADRIDYGAFAIISELLGDVASGLADSEIDLAEVGANECAT
jgi:hypothetical protein